MAESSARRSEGNAVAAERTERDRGRCVLYKQGAVWGEERGQLWAACRMVTAWDWVQLLYEICARVTNTSIHCLGSVRDIPCCVNVTSVT